MNKFFAYFIGGPLDLTKQVVESAPPNQEVYIKPLVNSDGEQLILKATYSLVFRTSENELIYRYRFVEMAAKFSK